MCLLGVGFFPIAIINLKFDESLKFAGTFKLFKSSVKKYIYKVMYTDRSKKVILDNKN